MPHTNHTSELGTTFYPQWVWMGRQLKKLKLPFRDDIYYKYPASIPFLSTFYPIHFLTSLTENFNVLHYSILSHFILGSSIAYYLFLQWCHPLVALFGAITLFYSGYCIKVQQPCIVYTMAWIPGIFLDGWFGVLSMTMTLLGGYYPILVYLIPFILIVHTKTVLLGILLALPQIIPFLVYYLKSVRLGEMVNQQYGKIPLKKLTELFLPIRKHQHTNGVFYMEMAMYMGFLPFLFMWESGSRFWIVLIYGLSVCVGWLKPIQRIPARALYIVTLSITILAADGLNKLGLRNELLIMVLILQGTMLLFNRDIYPCYPFTQWWNSDWEKMDYTGYLRGSSKNGYYKGAFALK